MKNSRVGRKTPNKQKKKQKSKKKKTRIAFVRCHEKKSTDTQTKSGSNHIEGLSYEDGKTLFAIIAIVD